MNREEFYTIVKQEGLNCYNIGDSHKISQAANVIGCVNQNDKWIVYETSEKAKSYIICEKENESEGLSVLLEELRNRKRKEEIFEKLERGKMGY